MLITRSEIDPPTITIAKGRWKSEPIPCDMAAGKMPNVATSIVITSTKGEGGQRLNSASDMRSPLIFNFCSVYARNRRCMVDP